MKLSSLILLFVFGIAMIPSQAISQTHQSVKGRVLSKESGKAIAFATVVLNESQKWSTTNLKGEFSIDNVQNGEYTIIVSCLGYKKIQDTISLTELRNPFTLHMSVESQDLSEVTVIAEESRENGTSSVIKKDALNHLQPSSFADILELLPGGVSSNRSLTSMNLISLRAPVETAKISNRENTYNSSLGTAFVVDGTPLSNDAQLQTVSGAVTYTNTSDDYLVYRNTTGKGIDMRMIPTDDIESVEIVRGIPSVAYGSLSSGLVNIQRSYKKKPLELRAKANSGMKLFALGKGFEFGNKTLNVNLDYINYKSDPRNVMTNYSRMTASLRFKDVWNTNSGMLKLKTNINYTGSFDESKRDEENDTKDEFYKNDYNKYRLASNLNYYFDRGIVKNINFSVSGSYTFENKKIRRYRTGRMSPILIEKEEGEYYGEFLPASYLANLKIEGKPVFLFANLNSKLDFDVLGTNHNLIVGADWRYNKNFGRGEVFDVTRPLYAGNGRPRPAKDIPAMEELAIYAEENLLVPIGLNRLKIRVGVRAASLLNVSDKYCISNKFYLDPRFNLSWQFPSFMIFDKLSKLSVRTGFGWHTKFPTLSHLYPNKVYYDAVQLNFYSQNDQLRQMHYKTKIIDPTNFALKPNRNQKMEVGLEFKSGKIKFDITAYKEEMSEGLRRMSNYDLFSFKKYIIESGPDPSTLNAPPTIDMFDYKQYKRFVSYGQSKNGSREEKKGIEYQLDLGRIEAIKSRVSINGAWMYMKYGSDAPRYKTSSVVIGGDDYPYMGYYEWDTSREYEQFNTNFRFDTQIDELGLIFSSTFQVLWYTSWKYSPHNGMPSYYIDMNDNKFEYTEADTQDPILKHLYEKPSDNAFDTERVPITIDYNLKVTKLINQNMRLAFYVNRILYYYPDYNRKDGFRVKRSASPYFGMELNINI
ncbi:carboxypeptidase-like regulatory domain-containing protein [Marinifilum fragile]|uniref:TonB-dependent receptor n=1 Tax=Marinifilum fragile TaxID=570161 RepID=UPI002AA624F8|nr:carboxypeptidase-like regulatory domain-containing protein [Marinifilum fragile]